MSTEVLSWKQTPLSGTLCSTGDTVEPHFGLENSTSTRLDHTSKTEANVQVPYYGHCCVQRRLSDKSAFSRI